MQVGRQSIIQITLWIVQSIIYNINLHSRSYSPKYKFGRQYGI